MDNPEQVNLRDFFDVKFKAIEDHTNTRFDALDKALVLAHEDAKIKFEHLNALRNEVTTDRGILVPKELCRQTHNEIQGWREEVNRKLTILETRSITWTAAVGIFFIIIMLVMKWYGK